MQGKVWPFPVQIYPDQCHIYTLIYYHMLIKHLLPRIVWKEVTLAYYKPCSRFLTKWYKFEFEVHDCHQNSRWCMVIRMTRKVLTCYYLVILCRVESPSHCTACDKEIAIPYHIKYLIKKSLIYSFVKKAQLHWSFHINFW